jgi:carbonic anhydrase/acetyltransferase-like protein (isoleucine patch superfamily)
MKFQSKTPQVNASFVAQSATILGNVKVGLKSSIWYGAIIRGMLFFLPFFLPFNFIFHIITNHD